MSAQDQRRVSVFPIPSIRHTPHNAAQSRNTQQRNSVRQYIVNATNLAICALNSLYSPAAQQPIHIPYADGQPVYKTLYKIDYTPPHGQVHNLASQYAIPTTSQQRMQQNILQACKRMLHVSHPETITPPESDDNINNNAQSTSTAEYTYHLHTVHELNDLVESNTCPSAPELNLAYACKATAMPIVAHLVSLPSQLHAQPMLSLLNAQDAALYLQPSNNLLLTTTEYAVLTQELLHNNKMPPSAKVLGSQQQYTRLIQRMYEVGMVGFTTRPLCVNGVFAVPKADGAQRIIIDAQPCNLHFREPPYVRLPSPTHLARLRVDSSATLHLAKLDLSNFYHHIQLPRWMQPYFSLPAVHVRHISAELTQRHGDIEMHPMCTTLPMGFSHSVYIAQQIHNNVLYKDTTLKETDNILQRQTPHLSAAIHMLYIDDNCILGTSAEEVTAQYHACIAAYTTAGLQVKPEKCTATTSAPTEVLGIMINGLHREMSIQPAKMLKLLGQTLYVIHKQQCTGATLARLMGHWTWVLMLRRPLLSVIRYCYIFIDVYKGGTHALWPAVVKELYQLIALAPFIYADLSSPILDVLPASDASTFGNGVVFTYTTPETSNALYQLCCYNPKHHVTDDNPNGLLRPTAYQITQIQHQNYHTIISHRWRHSSPNINELELQSVLSLVKHLVTRPATLHSSILHLIDNHSAFSCLRKGRASSVLMNMVLRKITAHLVAHDITLLSIWVPSELNPADPASRLQNATDPT